VERQITLTVDAISHWDELSDRWYMEPGRWLLSVGSDASTMAISTPFLVAQMLPWSGL
jgi:hypothetical protein